VLFERHSVEDLNEVRLASAHDQDVRGSSDEPEQSDTLVKNLVEGRQGTYDRREAWELFLKMSDHATWMVPSLVSLKSVSNYTPPPATDTELKLVADPTQNSASALGSPWQKNANAMRDINLVVGMHRAGIQFLAGTNGPDLDLVAGKSLHQELELLVACGFTPLEALQAATFNPALSMAKLDKFGVVEPGHVANLVLLSANPLTDIRNTQKIAGVVVRGSYLSRAGLDGLLVKAEQIRRAPADTARVGEFKSEP
jgi:imidazolonepropionase-like amidohydrolase